MPIDLREKVEAIESAAFDNGAARQQFPEVAQLFLRLLAYLLEEQQPDGWVTGTGFTALGTAHMLRVLTRMYTRLDDRWYMRANSDGNLRRIAEGLLERFENPTDDRPSYWGVDFWDDSYVLLALQSARAQLNAQQKAELAMRQRVVIRHLRAQLHTKFANVQHGEWFGPGLYAAAAYLFDDDVSSVHIRDGLLDVLGDPAPWVRYFGWHAGQVVTMYDTIGKTRPALAPLEKRVGDLYAELLSLQDAQGAWTQGGMAAEPEKVIYNSIRALAAAYGREQPDSPVLAAAHRFFLKKETAVPSLRADVKGCINAVEMFDDLFRLRLPLRDTHVLINLTTRLRRLKLDELVMARRGGGDVIENLRRVQLCAQRQLEERGQIALGPLGVNAQLLEALNENVADQFGSGTQVRDALDRFLSATMTETRGNAAHDLIRGLWSRPGYLNFVPFFERLTQLEYTGGFFEDYRDHTNHQLLVFLLGAHIYYSNEELRHAVDAEIAATSEARGVTISDPEAEFLFRWKLAANFHDVGYIFEVSPRSLDADGDAKKMKTQSLDLMNEYAAAFLRRFLEAQNGEPANVQKVVDKIKKYPALRKIEDVFRLRSVRMNRDAFARLTSFLPEAWQAGDGDLVRSYFNLCRTTRSDGLMERPPFLDHGIMSGLILLLLIDIQTHYLFRLHDLVGAGELRDDPALDIVRREDFRQHVDGVRFFARFEHVAGAIALHNIYPRLYKEETCAKVGLDRFFYRDGSDRFSMAPRKPDVHLTLAYLLALTDALQDWDRHSFRPPRFSDSKEKTEPITAAEVLLQVRDSGITIRPLTGAAGRSYAKKIDDMKATLEHLPDFLRCG